MEGGDQYYNYKLIALELHNNYSYIVVIKLHMLYMYMVSHTVSCIHCNSWDLSNTFTPIEIR